MTQSSNSYTIKKNPYFKNGEPLIRSKVLSKKEDILTKKSNQLEKVFKKKLFIESYGCQMNFSDSEIVASILSENGYQITES